MKLPSSDIHTETNLSTKEYQFKIDENDQGIIFEMLRSKIYKDPIGSICREVASNSRDAHREVKKDNTPIDIIIHNQTIMNNGSLTIEFKDYGTGISEDRMENIFCKYAASTKRDTNLMTGGFGLGAKTPFSYSDVFHIKTVYDKIQYTYTAYIDESKKGKITLHKKTDTDEGNGTSIIIPIKNSTDRQYFETMCKFFTDSWEVKPNFKNFTYATTDVNEEIYKGDKYSIIKKKSVHIGPIALIDGIPYIIDVNANTLFKRSLDYSTPVTVMYFKNGELDVSINRETLQYNNKTIDILNKRFKIIQKDFIILFNDYLKTSKNYLEACYNLKESYHNYNNSNFSVLSWLTFYNSKQDIKLTYNGELIDHNLSIKYLRFNRFTKYTNSPIVSDRIQGDHLSTLYNNDLYLLDRGKSTNTSINYEIFSRNPKKQSFIILGLRSYNKRIPTDVNSTEYKFYIKDKEKFEAAQEIEYEFVTTKLGKQLINYSSIKPSKEMKERNLPTSVHVKEYRENQHTIDYTWHNLILTRDNVINKKDAYFYIVIDKAGDEDKFKSNINIKNYMLAKYYNKQLICITKRQQKYFEEYTELNSVDDKITIPFITQCLDYVELNKIQDRFKNRGYDKFTYNQKIQDAIEKSVSKIKEFKKEHTIVNLSKNTLYLNTLGAKISDDVIEYKDKIASIETIYPLVAELSSWNIKKEIITDINLYIKYKDKELELKTI